MLKFFLCITLFILSSTLYAQQGYRVTYQNDTYSLPATFNGEKQKIIGPTDKLVFNDGFPGLVMEVIDQRYKMHLVVKKIEKGDYTVIMPTGVRIITIEERRKKFGK
jgi:hypothetical protein